jgi:hypothetical protein
MLVIDSSVLSGPPSLVCGSGTKRCERRTRRRALSAHMNETERVKAAKEEELTAEEESRRTH